ncbi:MAG: aminotransferase class IV, partial [Bacteroidia bacterium]|nr:aminotransferase class IV [Bacteroidia bacterium]
MAKLQRPDLAYMNGKLIPWDDAVIHVGTEAVNRGLNVFEGLKGYWQGEDKFGLVFLEKHYKRLLRSAKLLHIPCPWTFEQYEQAIFELMGALLTTDRDMWIRTTLFVIEGYWGENTKADLVMCAYHQDKAQPEPIHIGISTWQRATDAMLPPRIKTSTNYQVGRLARVEGRPRGMEDMILLNQYGRVAESTGSCVLMVRDGAVYTPPASEGALESVTLDYTEALAKSLGIPFIRRPIDRTELLIADEIAICGSLAELVPIKKIDNYDIDPYGPLLTKIREKFFNTVRGIESFPELEMSFVP